MCPSMIFSFTMPAFSPSPSPSPSSVFRSSCCTPSRPNESWTPPFTHRKKTQKTQKTQSPYHQVAGIFRISSHKISSVDLFHSPSKSGSSLCTLSPIHQNDQIAMCPKNSTRVQQGIPHPHAVCEIPFHEPTLPFSCNLVTIETCFHCCL